MELQQLEYFCKVAEREHITQAAKELNITQPALSKNIARLEKELGVNLFEREGKSVQLNEYGELTRRYAEKILYILGDLRAELAEMRAGHAGNVRMGSAFPLGEPNWMLECVRSFALERPDVSFHLRQYAVDEIEKALTEREIDLAVSSVPIRGVGVCWRELFEEPLGVILSIHHPLAAARDKLSLAELRQERFYCNNANSDVQQLTYDFCNRAGFQPNIHFECDFPSYIGEAVSLGYGISLISERGYLQGLKKTVRQSWEDNIVYRPLSEDYCRRMCGIAYLEGRHLPQAAQAFCSHLLDHRDQGGKVI